jgi:hypothetical protein
VLSAAAVASALVSARVGSLACWVFGAWLQAAKSPIKIRYGNWVFIFIGECLLAVYGYLIRKEP